MHQVIEFFRGLFDTSLWPPRWHCGKWTEFHGWLYIISDLMIFFAYFAMPVIIVRYIATRTNSRFHKIYFLFAAFILACGFTHLLDAITFWYPVYRFNALVRFITGIISWVTVYSLFKVLPVAFSLKTAGELEVEVEQRKKAENSLRMKNALLNEAQEMARLGHWEWTVATNEVYWSDNLFKIYGHAPQKQSLPYEQFLQCVHPDDRSFVDSTIRQTLVDKKFADFYHRIVTPAGRLKTLHSKGEVIIGENGEIVKMIGTGQDVTEQKLIEQELRIKSSELESRNAELQKFAYVASHDLQEPLRKIRTFISRLDNEEDEVLDENRKKLYMSKIVSASERMQRLIDDILNFSRLSHVDAAFFQKTDLNVIVRSVLTDMEVVLEAKRAEVEIGDLPAVEGNATQMSQLFQNLLSNAIKFQETGKQPHITISGEVLTGREINIPDHLKSHYKFSGWQQDRFWAEEKFCKIVITDNGIGFDAAYGELIFEAFQRLERDYEGTGIGLAICKKITENHNGMISARNMPWGGSAFTVILPVSQANFGKNPVNNN